MKKLNIITILILSLATFVLPQSSQKCFVNAGLEDKHIVYLTIDGAKVTGEFTVEKGYETATTYNFSGTNLNNNLSISFANNKFPYQLPPKAKKGVWILKTVDSTETLQVKIYGKNYETNKWSSYSANYEPCDSSYEVLAKRGQRVIFAKGATSAVVEVALADKADEKAYWLNLSKGQKFSIEAPGCGIAIFYPDKTRDSEGAIDTWGTSSLSQSGDYLFVFSMAGEWNKCTVKFSTK